ncbi:MAG: putative transmembrane anti-sigma factor [Spirochaetes bacterium]|nr:MAG: putative transmembrane anti-sigma factor [Spirochaetota bacterium]
MCPDDALLSSFVDGEVPSPWKERLEAHVEKCPRCDGKLKAFGSLSSLLQRDAAGPENSALEAAKYRIDARLGSLGKPAPYAQGSGLVARLSSLLGRRIVVPMPYLAGGILALVFMAGITLGFLSPVARASRLLASASKTLPASQASYETIVQYMRQHAVDAVMIEMPSSAAFSQMGIPVFVSYGEPLIEMVPSAAQGGGSFR